MYPNSASSVVASIVSQDVFSSNNYFADASSCVIKNPYILLTPSSVRTLAASNLEYLGLRTADNPFFKQLSIRRYSSSTRIFSTFCSF